MKKLIAIVVLFAITAIPAFAETTMEELEQWAHKAFWSIDTIEISDDVSLVDMCVNDMSHDYHITCVFEGQETEGTWRAQIIVSGKDGWIGNWYDYNWDQFEADWIDIVTEMYEGTLR